MLLQFRLRIHSETKINRQALVLRPCILHLNSLSICPFYLVNDNFGLHFFKVSHLIQHDRYWMRRTNLTFQKNYATKRLERNDGKSRWKRLCHELFYVFLHWSDICNIIYIYIMYVWYILETQPMRCIGSSRGIGESFSGLLKTRPILIRGCTGGYAPMGCSLFSYLFTPFSDAAP